MIPRDRITAAELTQVRQVFEGLLDVVYGNIESSRSIQSREDRTREALTLLNARTGPTLHKSSSANKACQFVVSVEGVLRDRLACVR